MRATTPRLRQQRAEDLADLAAARASPASWPSRSLISCRRFERHHQRADAGARALAASATSRLQHAPELVLVRQAGQRIEIGQVGQALLRRAGAR